MPRVTGRSKAIREYVSLARNHPAEIERWADLIAYMFRSGQRHRTIEFIKKNITGSEVAGAALYEAAIICMKSGEVETSLDLLSQSYIHKSLYKTIANKAECLLKLRFYDASFRLFCSIHDRYNPDGAVVQRLELLKDKQQELEAGLELDKWASPLIDFNRETSNNDKEKPKAAQTTIQSVKERMRIYFPDLDFIPSFTEAEHANSMKHILHQHIPKTAGMRFSNPILACLRKLESLGSYSDFGCCQLLAVEQLHTQKEAAAYGAWLHGIHNPSIYNRIEGGFVQIFSTRSKELVDIYKSYFKNTYSIAFIREPNQRLRSALNYLYRVNECSTTAVRECIFNRHLHLDNPMARFYLQDFDKRLDHENTMSRLSLSLSKSSGSDIVAESGDDSLRLAIQTCFLSANKMPNIVTNKRINATKAGYAMRVEDMQEMLELVEVNGLNLLDNEIFKCIKKKGRRLVNSCYPDIEKNDNISEWTYIYISDTQECLAAKQALVRTSDIVQFLEANI